MALMLQRARDEVVRLRDTSTNATVTKNSIEQAERARDGFEATLRSSDAQIAREKERMRSLEQRVRAAEKALVDHRTALERLAAAGSSPVDMTTKADGRVAELRKRLGDVVRSDEILMIVEPLDTELTAVSFVDPGRPIRSGMEVRVFPFTVDSEAYGYIVGKVATVGDHVALPDEVEAVTANKQVTADILSSGVKIEVRVVLQRSDATPSGYTWSTPAGPPYKIQPGTRVRVAVIVGHRAPWRRLTGG
jgi:multidrug efflux pump subunit AcrA (membrane-fusion protein)